MNFVFTCWFFVFKILFVLSMCDFFEISLFFCSVYILYPHTIKLFLTSFFFYLIISHFYFFLLFVVKITANACLFVLLEAFVQNQRPYAPYVYKTLIFSLIESKADNQSLREFMMASMSQSMNTLRQIPVR